MFKKYIQIHIFCTHFLMEFLKVIYYFIRGISTYSTKNALALSINVLVHS